MIAVLPWLFVVEALAAAALPLTMRVFRNFPDRGLGLGRVLAIVLVGVACWLTDLLGMTAYRPATAVTVALALALVAWSAWGRECRVLVAARWRLLVALEAAFLAPLAVGIGVRAYNADIIGQEKFMDFAFMHALLRAVDLPAEDMWLAGFGLPYYYLSYLLAGLPAKIAGTDPPIAYNLALAFVFAAGFAAVASIVYALLARPRASSLCRRAFPFALVGGALVMVVGNLVGPLELVAAAGWGDPGFWQAVGVKGLSANPSGGLLPADGGWWWRSSRVIPNIPPDGITEFPYFSFILGDLHPHYVAIVLDLLIVALALDPWLGEERGFDGVRAAVAAPVLAALVAASTWDVPTFWGLFVLAGITDAWRRHRNRDKLLARLPSLVLPVVGAVALIAPYFVGYQSQRLGLGIVAERTPLVSLLILFGPALAAATLLGIWLLRRPLPPPPADTELPSADDAGREAAEGGTGSGWLVAIGLALVAFAALGEPTLALLGSLALLLGWAGWRLLGPGHGPVAGASGPALFTWLLATYAVVILIVVELVFVRDVFGTRMNTVFKFHYHVWIMLGVATAATLETIWAPPSITARVGGWRFVAGGLTAVILAAGLVYPLAATWTKSGQFHGGPTLDGERFLERSAPADLRAIEWLRTSVSGRPVVVEAVGGSYQEFARVSTFAGLPTIVGWVGHELQWRGERPEYAQREQDVDRMYRAETREEILGLARRYDARYLFFGALERDKYGPDAQARLDSLLPVAFSGGGTTIYLLAEHGEAGR
ncbi:MAG: DUF2298 domain-containing protein [Chloroflexota bacterium]|nr:DUF2298 domain-containing protein [Chloroflexota bacterium]